MAAAGVQAKGPLTEVVVVVWFKERLGLDLLKRAQVAEEFLCEFEQMEERLPLVSDAAQHATLTLGAIGKDVNPLRSAPPPRLWFHTPGEGWLVQLQEDLFALNLRELAQPDLLYPGFERVQERFVQEYCRLLAALQEVGAPAPTLARCELTYLNLITAEHLPADTALTVRNVVPSLDTGTLAGRQASLNVQWQTTDDPNSALSAVLFDGRRNSDQTAVIGFNLSARAEVSDFEAALVSLRHMHAQANRVFTELVSPALLALWGCIPVAPEGSP